MNEEADSTSSLAEFRRQSSSSGTIVVAHVYLLPQSLDAQDISDMEEVSWRRLLVDLEAGYAL